MTCSAFEESAIAGDGQDADDDLDQRQHGGRPRHFSSLASIKLMNKMSCCCCCCWFWWLLLLWWTIVLLLLLKLAAIKWMKLCKTLFTFLSFFSLDIHPLCDFFLLEQEAWTWPDGLFCLTLLFDTLSHYVTCCRHTRKVSPFVFEHCHTRSFRKNSQSVTNSSFWTQRVLIIFLHLSVFLIEFKF